MLTFAPFVSVGIAEKGVVEVAGWGSVEGVEK